MQARSIRQLLIAAAVLVSGTGCGADFRVIAPVPGPYTSGTIRSIDPTRGYLIEGQPGSAGLPQVYVQRTSETKLVWEDGTAATDSSLTIGRFIYVWINGRRDSDPPQIMARTIVLTTPLP